jgi:3-dehydroquinate dehydratase type II
MRLARYAPPMRRVLVINGPNLNLLGVREPAIYGTTTLAELDARVKGFGASLGLEVDTFQTNHEGAIIDRLHAARTTHDGVVLNGGAFTHYSYAIHDAIVASELPTVEVHISDIHTREKWRHTSVTAPACVYGIAGRGIGGYDDALSRLVAVSHHPGVRVGYGDELPDHHGELRLPDGDPPYRVAVLVHGGFWRNPWTLDTTDRLAIDLTERGWATWNIEYRRVGTGGGIPETPNDVARAIEHLNGLDPGALELMRVAVIGHSAGGHLAQWVAGEPLEGVVIRRVVSLAGVSDLAMAHELGIGRGAVAELFEGALPLTAEELHSYSPAHREPLRARQLVVHGTEDEDVPVAMSDAYVEVARERGDNVTYLRREGVGHMEVVDPASATWHEVVRWLEA